MSNFPESVYCTAISNSSTWWVSCNKAYSNSLITANNALWLNEVKLSYMTSLVNCTYRSCYWINSFLPIEDIFEIASVFIRVFCPSPLMYVSWFANEWTIQASLNFSSFMVPWSSSKSDKVAVTNRGFRMVPPKFNEPRGPSSLGSNCWKFESQL